MARLLGFSRAEFYRGSDAIAERDQALRDEIHAIALDWPRYGYRTISRELRRRGWVVNEKRVRRIMRQDGLICRRRKARGLPYRRHGLTTYPNLAATYTPTGIDQLWVADFTYVRLFGAFIFVAVILDAYSRRCVGWAIANHYRTELTLAALEMALCRRQPPRGLIHHSDRGCQYAAEDYVQLLLAHGAKISMSRPARPADNAVCERFMRTFKEEEIQMRDYLDLADAHKSIARYLEVTYNQRRLHSAIGYVPPAEFERVHLEPNLLSTPA